MLGLPEPSTVYSPELFPDSSDSFHLCFIMARNDRYYVLNHFILPCNVHKC